MATLADAPPRPAMRRKSSAQNLLNSFKSGTSGSSTPVPPSVGSMAVSHATGLSFSSGATTPITATMPTTTASLAFNKEWDVQSLHSDTHAGSTLGGAGSPQLGQGTSTEYLRDMVQKRILTLTYIRNIHEGRSHWFHTILISRAELDREFSNSNPDVRKRAYRYAILGMSLSHLLDINQPQDLLRGLMNMIHEYDQNKDDSDKPKIRPSKRLFKPKTAKRAGTGSFTEYAGSLTDTSDTSYLMVPHMPFALDYHQTLISLLDIISEVYNKIFKILGPSPFPQSSQHMMGPLGLLSPHPGVSYLFSGENTAVPNQPYNYHPYSDHNPDGMSSSLWNIANPSGGAGINYGGVSSPPVAMSASLVETVLKIDGKVKKITSSLLKELDVFARNGIKDELASLDPLLTTAGSGGKSLYEEGT